MKKRFCILTLLLACIVSAQAQWFSLGVKGGYNTTLEHDQSYQEVFDIKSNLRNGFHLGLYMRMGRTWYVQPEALFNYYNYNSSLNYENTNIFKDKKYQINTVDIPVLLGTHLVNTKMFKMRAMVGPKFSLNIGSTIADTFEDIESLTQVMRETRLGLDCGIGFDIWRITLDVRYNLIQDIYKYQNSEGITLNNKPLHSIQASIGYRIAGNNKKQVRYRR